MKKNILIVLLFLSVTPVLFGQMPSAPMGGMHPQSGDLPSDIMKDELSLEINSMSVNTRMKVNDMMQDLQTEGTNRSVLAAIGLSMANAGVSALVEVATTELIHLTRYRKEQKAKWERMIQNECNYTDSLTNIQGLKDFYSETSQNGALDPSNINFDGITLRGVRQGEEMLYISCHIDTTRLDHLFNHSKFYLVLDTMSFNPYKCHLPNLEANGIRQTDKKKSGRDNSFSFTERNQLRVGLEISISSSWINQATMVHKNVQLGSFKIDVQIDSVADKFTYSRRQALYDREHSIGNSRLIEVEGDCFVVPRSFMPVSAKVHSWGTGEYNMKVKFRESCQFNTMSSDNKKAKNWHKDYKELRKMQNQKSEVVEYVSTVYQQNKETVAKSVIRQGLNTGVSNLGLSSSGSSTAAGSAGGGSMPSGGSSATGSAPTGSPAMMGAM